MSSVPTCSEEKHEPSFRARKPLSYPFIKEHAQFYPVSTLCRVLESSVSGYYDWLKREPSAHAREDGEVAKQIHRMFHAHRGVYGSPRVHVELRAQGIRCSRERTARLMREMDLAAKRRRNKPIGTKRRNGTQCSGSPGPCLCTHYNMGQ